MSYRLALLAAASLVAACASTVQFSYTAPNQPEGATGGAEKPGWSTSKFAVAAANPLATDAGYQVLKAGGTAVSSSATSSVTVTLSFTFPISRATSMPVAW